jgi:hypothetical protein
MMRRRVSVLALVASGVVLSSAAPAVAGGSRPFDIRATVRLLPQTGGDLVQKGTFVGTPLGHGNVVVHTQLGGRSGASVHFTMTNKVGTVSGGGAVTVSFKGTVVTYSGTARVTSGSGQFAGVRASSLHVQGSGDMAGGAFTVSVTGS